MRTLVAILFLSLFTLLFSCKKPNEIEDNSPRIKSVSIAGVPAENVQFDPEQRTIRVLLPAIIPDSGMIPVFELSENSEIQSGLTADGKLDISTLCWCFYRERNQVTSEHRLIVGRKNILADEEPASLYRLTIYSPEGCLKPIPDIPITYTNKANGSNAPFIWVNLPVQNLYRKEYVKTYFLKNIRTGQMGGISTANAGTCLHTCGETSVNTLSFAAGSGLGSGEYEVSLLTICDSNRIVFPQPLIIE